MRFEPDTRSWSTDLRLAPLAVYVAAYTFFVLSGRPTADEYLLAPVFNGYYVDRPNLPLFEPSDNGLIRYLQGARAMVKLGWDGWLNALTFQMGSGVLTNYGGPVANLIQGIVLAAVVTLSLCLIARQVLSNRKDQWVLLGFMGLGIMAGLSVGNFNTPRLNFGLYPFLGIRFSLYMVHAVVLIALVIALVASENREKPLLGRRLVLATVVYCGMASLWYVMYLVIFIALRGIVSSRARIARLGYLQVGLIVALSTSVFQDGFRGVRGRTAASSRPITETIQSYFTNVVLNPDSRLFKTELWSTVLGRHALIGVLTGLCVAMLLPKDSVRSIDLFRHTRIAVVGSLLLPPVFLFQEFITYEAWWHRTTPITISTFSWILVGISSWMYVQESRGGHNRLLTLPVVASIMLLVIPVSVPNLQSINRFRVEWDKGNILGLGSPVENNADYNVINAFRVHPYVNPRWNAQDRMLNSIPLEVLHKDCDGRMEPLINLQLEACGLEILISASPFDVELGNRLDYELSVTGSQDAPLTITVDDAQGRRDLVSAPDRTISISGEVALPGRITVRTITSEAGGIVPGKTILHIGFSSSLRQRFMLQDDDLVQRHG